MNILKNKNNTHYQKFACTNGIIYEIILSVNCGDHYRRTLFRPYFSQYIPMEYCSRYIPTKLQTEYSELKKSGSLTWSFLRAILSMKSPRDSNPDLRTVMWPILRQNCRWNHWQNEFVSDFINKSEYITTLLTFSSPISPSSSPSQLSPPKLQTTTP